MQMQTSLAKPCLALMGEFSAGKSTLANLLIGASPLPVRIIATQLPPVKISHGKEAPYSVDLDGNRTPIEMDALDTLDMTNTHYLQLFSPEDLLVHCDLLDMPGISDPNMTSDVWERMIDHAQGVIWCSHAVQAWRQSEAAVWAEMPANFHNKSLLLLTQIDKVNSPTDRARIVTRVRRETEGLFREVLPISLLTATQEQENYDRWAQSGAEDLVSNLISLLNDLSATQGDADANVIPALKAPQQAAPPDNAPRIQPRRIRAAQHGGL